MLFVQRLSDICQPEKIDWEFRDKSTKKLVHQAFSTPIGIIPSVPTDRNAVHDRASVIIGCFDLQPKI